MTKDKIGYRVHEYDICLTCKNVIIDPWGDEVPYCKLIHCDSTDDSEIDLLGTCNEYEKV